jgi:PD-(D/E)XK endonuclease
MSTSVVGGVWIGDLWGMAERRGGRRRLASGFDEAEAFAGGGARATQVTGKRLGEIAEAAFLAKAAALGFGVAKPWGDSDRYDFILDWAGELWRVQVKSAHRAGEDGGYSFRAHGQSSVAYKEDEIDALVAYIVPEDVWYVFPGNVFRSLRSLKLFPGGRRSKFERYREAWGMLRRG